MTPPRLGISGRVAAFFIDFKLTPLLVMAALLLGVLAVWATPREEEPQIVVPMVDVMVPYPMASAQEVEARVVRPLQKRMAELEGVEHVYATAQPGQALVTVRFFVGTKVEDALVRLHAKVMASKGQLVSGVGEPVIAARSIDDVPIVTLTLWSERLGDPDLRRAAAVLEEEIKQVRHVSDVTLIGGRPRALTVWLSPARLAAHGLTPQRVRHALEAANVSLPAGAFRQGGQLAQVRVGALLRAPEALRGLVVGTSAGRPVHLRDVATVQDGAAEPESYVFFGTGPGAASPAHGHEAASAALPPGQVRPAVTVAVAKLKGTNAVAVAEAVVAKVQDLQGRVIPREIHVEVTRNYGQTAAHKAAELIEHLLIAMVSVILLIGVALGAREALVVGVAVPVTLAIALFLSMAYGYTLNRVTLFALIFAIGILVDDAIVVVENIHRWASRTELSVRERVVAAVDEVGNPTILATITVVATLMPMTFVSGLMGPYMAPIPINASVAMMFSLAVAFVVTPWFALRFLKADAHAAPDQEAAPRGLAAGYARLLATLVADRGAQRLFLAGVAALLLGVAALVALKAVYLKMLPFDNKSEFQVLIDMPEGTPLERTAEVARKLGDHLAQVNEVTTYQLYVGTAAPFNFNGLVRHYYMRAGDHLADLQVNLRDKTGRKAQSHDVARRLREPLQALAAPYGANVKVVEIPPGPPVLSPLVAEVYGPTAEARAALAAQVAERFRQHPEVVDVDIVREAPQREHRLVFGDKARLAGLSEAEAAQEVAAMLGGVPAGLLHDPDELEPVVITVRAPEAERSGLGKLLGLRLVGPGGGGVPLGELVRPVAGTVEPSRHAKNLQPVVYVIADVAGRSESPVYGMLALGDAIGALRGLDGQPVVQYFTGQPALTDHPAVKWDGEWQVTYEVFRDLGAAFGVGLVVIYLLIVGWFQSFRLPLVIMSPIPLTLVGIVPGHWLFGAFFTATSMIGAIALAGIIVRNSILLVEFAQAREAEGVPTAQAVVEAGLVRARPIFLTAGAVMVGALVILFDPIFQGLAISLIFGTFASTALTLVVVPVLYARLAGAGRP
ncbi:MAG: efflux RND transporter permease subunit [Candidatus Sericytochromatia bacterium]|nr:efflux RND transporter permease subunit [Candidatus Sericytochromatia bacterium]